MPLSHKQLAALRAVRTGGLMPIIHAGALSDAGLVEKLKGQHAFGSKRGYSAVIATQAGKAKLDASSDEL